MVYSYDRFSFCPYVIDELGVWWLSWAVRQRDHPHRQPPSPGGLWGSLGHTSELRWLQAAALWPSAQDSTAKNALGSRPRKPLTGTKITKL